MKREPTIRISAFPVPWLDKNRHPYSFVHVSKTAWSTGRRIKPGDIQIFAVSATLGDATRFENDPRRDSVHSIWEATSSIRPELGNPEFPIQAEFRLRVKLKVPVSKAILHREGILSVYAWPRNSSGKLLHDREQVLRLAEILSKYNSNQRTAIFKALNVEE